MKEPEELEPMRKIDEIRRLSNKELRLTKKSMGALTKSSEYCGPIRKKSYIYVSAVIGIAYNPFLSEDILDCFFDYEQAVLLRFWTSRIATIKSATFPQTKLGLVLEEKVTAPSVPKTDKRVEFGLGFSNELLRTSLMVVWDLMRPSWCPSPNADSILRATQDVQRELNADCNLRDLNIIYNVMITASRSNGEEKVELPGWGREDWQLSGGSLWTGRSRLWRSGLCKSPRETTQAIDDIVWECRDESKNGNGTDRRLPWRNQGESSDCTRILQHVWFFRVTIESRTET